MYHDQNCNALQKTCMCAPGVALYWKAYTWTSCEQKQNIVVVGSNKTDVVLFYQRAQNPRTLQGPYRSQTPASRRADGNQCCELRRQATTLSVTWLCIHSILWRTNRTCWHGFVNEFLFEFHFRVRHRSGRAAWFAFRWMHSLLLKCRSGIEHLQSSNRGLQSKVSPGQLGIDNCTAWKRSSHGKF